MKALLLKILNPIIAKYHYLRIKLSIYFTRQKVTTKSELIALEELELKGFVKIQDSKFVKYAKIIEKKFYTNDEEIFNKNDEHIIEVLSTTANRIGNYSSRVSFQDPNVAAALMDKKVMAILSGYLGKCFYRENPLVEFNEFKNPAEAARDIVPYAVSFHADFYRQLNVMLLLSDVTENDTCTEYAVGSNQRNVFVQGSNIGYPMTNSIISKSNYQLEKITGKKGDLIIMDTTGIHRVHVQSGSKRKLLVGVLNCNYPFYGYLEKLSQTEFKNSNSEINPSAIKLN